MPDLTNTYLEQVETVPPFLTIKAQQIHDWAEGNIEAHQLLPVLLRKLIHSIGPDLHQVDFPGYDNAERKGWDGLVETGAATPWIPQGKSCWEFSTNREPNSKAESDYVLFVFCSCFSWSRYLDSQQLSFV